MIEIRTCGKCEYIYLKARACPKCGFGSYSAYDVYDSWIEVFWQLIFKSSYKKRLKEKQKLGELNGKD